MLSIEILGLILLIGIDAIGLAVALEGIRKTLERIAVAMENLDANRPR